MLLINKILLSFVFALFASTSAVKEINTKTNVSQIVSTVSEKEAFIGYANGNQKVVEAYKNFEASLRSSELSDEDVNKIIDATLFAAEKHKKQTRKNREKTPYIIHPIGVAQHILTIGKVSNPDILIAALLHDTVEDTNTTFVEIQETFGPSVEGYVREVTDDKTLSREKIKELQIAHAHEKSKGAAIIKMADKLYNLQDLATTPPPPTWSKARCDAYYDFAEKVLQNLPSANSGLKAALEGQIQSYRAQS